MPSSCALLSVMQVLHGIATAVASEPLCWVSFELRFFVIEPGYHGTALWIGWVLSSVILQRLRRSFLDLFDLYRCVFKCTVARACPLGMNLDRLVEARRWVVWWRSLHFGFSARKIWARNIWSEIRCSGAVASFQWMPCFPPLVVQQRREDVVCWVLFLEWIHFCIPMFSSTEHGTT